MNVTLPTFLGMNQGLGPGTSLDVHLKTTSHTGVLIEDVVELVGELRVNLRLDFFRVLKVASCATELDAQGVFGLFRTLSRFFSKADTHLLD